MNTNLIAVLAKISTVLITNWTAEKTGWFDSRWVEPKTGTPVQHVSKVFPLRLIGEVKEVKYLTLEVNGEEVTQELHSKVVATGSKTVWTDLVVHECDEVWTNHLSFNVTNNIIYVTP